MLSAKQGNHWYQVLAFGMTRPIEAVQNMFCCQIYKKVFI